MWPPEAFQARYTSAEYDDLVDSYELDPPPADILRTTNNLLAELLAVYWTVHRNTEQHPEPFRRADFLPDPDKESNEDESEGMEGDEGLEGAVPEAIPPIAAALNPLGAVATGHQLVMGSGSRIDPNGPLGAFFRGGAHSGNQGDKGAQEGR